jgi:hypothetical protein
MEAEKNVLKRALVDCSLSSEPPAAAMRILHQIEAGKEIFVIDISTEKSQGAEHIGFVPVLKPITWQMQKNMKPH